MNYTAFDPRVAIREGIGTPHFMNDTDTFVISVNDDLDEPVYLPLLLPGEVRSGDLPKMPFIEMKLVSSPARAMNISADVREQDCYVDFHIYYVNTENITATIFGKKVADKIVDLITNNRCTISTVTFMEVINDGIEYEEYGVDNTTVIFHRVVEVHCKNFNKN